MTPEEFTARYMPQFSEQQKAAVRETEGPVLLLAVPGSGKTTVLVTRLGYMALCRGIDPAHILAVTYTVAATRELRARFTARFPELAGRFRLIPYSAVGGAGLLAAFRPDALTVGGETRAELLAAVSPELQGDGFEAVI